MTVTELKVKHLEMVQTVITRMNQDSFLIKGWSVTLTSAVLALGFNARMPRFCLIAIIPILTFWMLDTFYIHRERLYRALHRAIAADIRSQSNEVPVFEMDTDPYSADIGPAYRCAFSRTVIPLYAVLGLVVGIIYITNS